MTTLYDLNNHIGREDLTYILFTLIALYALVSKAGSFIHAKINLVRQEPTNVLDPVSQKLVLYFVVMHISVMAMVLIGVVVLIWLKL